VRRKFGPQQQLEAVTAALASKRILANSNMVFGFLISPVVEVLGREKLVKTRLFISFDYDHDEDLRNLLAGQAKHPDTPFDIYDRSLKEPLTGDWKEKFRRRLANVDQMVVICGENTHLASGVAHEVKIAQEERKKYFMLWGRSSKTCTRPSTALATDIIYTWNWDSLKALISGRR
jgi:hypothetical protein